MEFSAVIVAAGSGSRAGGGDLKQWRPLGGKPVVTWSAEALLAAGARQLVVVIRPEQRDIAEEALVGLERWTLADGGATRADSVKSGLNALAPVDAVLIHDAARPFLNGAVIARLIGALETADGAIAALPVGDTLKRGDQTVAETVARQGLWRAQTPQAFRLDGLKNAYAALGPGAEPTDDAAAVEAAGGRVALVRGDPNLFKLTWPEDFEMADLIAAARMQTRTGLGFDAHRFGPGDHVWLGGVRIDHTAGLVGHSDADVALHALTDALLGAIGAGDIGQAFPPSDPQWRGAASHIFLRHAADKVAEAGGRIVNVDVTLICEAPKIGPHREAMRARIAEILDVEIARVAVKATTTEGMGFTGRGEGVAAQAAANVALP